MNSRIFVNHEPQVMRKSADAASSALERVRSEIDSIDDEICDLLEKRFLAVERVRSVKSAHGQASPIRPAREFAILNRLAGRPDHLVSTELKVRLWRIIMSETTLSQAPRTLKVSAAIAGSVPFRLLINEHFASIPVMVHKSDEDALARVGVDMAGLCVVSPVSNWSQVFLSGEAGEARVIGCLPLVRSAEVPDLLILGHAEPEATGHDETIVISESMLGRQPPNWRVASGESCVAAYPGFHLRVGDWLAEPIVVDQSGGVKIAGQYSCLAGTWS